MKNIVLSLILIGFLVGCSSNAKKGEEAAATFCDILNKNANDQETLSSLEELYSKYKEYDTDSKFKDRFESNTACLSFFTKKIAASNIKQTVKGAFSNNLQVIPQDYKIEWNGKNSMYSKFRLKFKLKYIYSNYKSFDDIEGELTLLDKNNYPIEKYPINSNNGAVKLLKSNVNDEEWIDVELDRVGTLLSDGAIATAKLAVQNVLKAYSFEVYLDVKTFSQNYSSSSPSSTSNEVTSGYDNSSSNCDEALTEYEQFVDEYVQFIEKASDGDYSAIVDAPQLMQKAESAGRKLQSMGQAQLGSTCWDKYLSIQMKLSDATLKITKNLPKNMDNVQKQMDELKNLMSK